MQVRLIGYCVEGSLFLVYEYIENGYLSQHLRGSGSFFLIYLQILDPLTFWWLLRMMAPFWFRGSEYIFFLGRDPLTWAARVQIALDAARGLEYIHEHTVPVYIHRDIKSANILIDKNFRAKVYKCISRFYIHKKVEFCHVESNFLPQVADFGLTKLTEYGSSSLHTRLVGTFGYMPPE